MASRRPGFDPLAGRISWPGAAQLRVVEKNSSPVPLQKHRSKGRSDLTWAAVPLCMGGAGVRGFS